MEKDRKSPRLKNWDYGSNGLYFVTICTKNRIHCFGDIQDRKMIYKPAGAIANVLWYELEHRNKYILMGEFVVMPNHIHGIIQLENPNSIRDNIICGDVARNVPTINNQQMSAISPKSNSISTIIRSYKSAVTKHCNRLNLEFSWQSRYHDHIIRNDRSFLNISQYIIDNPINWKEDEFNS